MNIYILMTMGIVGMGGGQMYVRNKLLYMESKGWKVYAYGGLPGEPIIHELKGEAARTSLVLTSAPFVYSKHFVNDYVEKIISDCHIQEGDNVVVESGTAHMSYWGELIAERCNGKHICFLLDERNDSLVQKEYIPYFYFKYKRNELAGINNKSLSYLFRGYKGCCEESGPELPALCQNVVEDIDLPQNLIFPKADYTIGSIGRLEKPYVPYMIEEVCKYVRKNKGKVFNLLLIGSSNDNNRIEEIKKATSDIDNLNIIMTGYMFPISKHIFSMVDLFISSAGSAGVSYGQDVPTISIDASDCKPIGILGYTTSQSLYRNNEEIIELEEWLRKIFEEDFLIKHLYTPKENDTFELLKEHDKFLEKCEIEKKYFNVMKIHPVKKDLLKRIITIFVGAKGLIKIKEVANKGKTVIE